MSVRVLMLEPPTDLLEERARKGLDRWDEMWDGVLHVVPAPLERHQDIGSQLHLVLGPLANARDLRAQYETAIFRPGRDDDYRIPDLVVLDPAVKSRRGIEGAAHAAIEIRSPGDESYEKIAWYLEVGVREVVIIDRDTLHVEVFREINADGAPVRAGDTDLRRLRVTFSRRDDDHLDLTWPDGDVTIDLPTS